MRQQDAGDLRVVPQEIALGQAELWPEDLPEIREADLLLPERRAMRARRVLLGWGS